VVQFRLRFAFACVGAKRKRNGGAKGDRTMIATLAWKEYREHRSIWVAMACFAALFVVGLPAALAAEGRSWSPDGIGAMATGSACIIAIAYGLVCGAMMLAGEREAGTLTFLDTLTGRRTPLWSTKLITGAALTTAQAALITAILLPVASLANRSWTDQVLYFFPIALAALEAFIWGLFFSAVCRSALMAAGLAALSLAALWFLAGLFSVSTHDGIAVATVLHVVLTAGALGASWAAFHREGFRRQTEFLSRPGWQILLWLTYHQGGTLALSLAMIGFLAGLTLPWYGLVIWPTATLLTGIACGAAVFAGEQRDESHRFLGEQRLPVGRVWAIKSAVWLAVGVGVAVLILLGGLLHLAISDTVQAPTLNELQRPFLERVLGNGRMIFGTSIDFIRMQMVLPPTAYDAFLTLWLLYGFSIAQILTLVIRKTAVAVVIAVLVSVLVVSLWVPTLVSGGLALWQVLIPPVLLLAATRLAVWPLVGQRLHTAKALAGLIGGTVLAAGWVASVLSYRALEVPDVGEPFDVKAFEASLPTPEQNEAGRLMRAAAKELSEQLALVNKEFPPPNTEMVQGMMVSRESVWGRLYSALDNGWPASDGELDRWLDRMFAGEWAAHFRQAAQMPLGVLFDPRGLNVNSLLPDLQECRQAAQYFSGRALQLQARGDPAAGLDHLAVALALSRQLRNRSIYFCYWMGQGAETDALRGLDRWLDKLGPRPELLRRALDELGRHETLTPPLADSLKAEYLVKRNSFDDPSTWIFRGTGTRNRWLELLVLAWQAPWEHERRMRIVATTYAGWLRSAELAHWELAELTEEMTAREGTPRSSSLAYFRDWLPPVQGPAASLTPARLVRLIDETWLLREWMRGTMGHSAILSLAKPLADCRVHAARLSVALALYQAETGQPAERLEDLVPRYLAALPADPFSGQPFHYRVSRGERLVWEAERYPNTEIVYRDVPAGQGILWSVGPDRTDNGGKKRFIGYHPASATGLDVIFLVPAWPELRKGK
jgi:hypothetical protein